ncbi:MAG TPA: hypothetical protein PL033_04445 [Candidatus Brocadiia bacterium]|nr:hypothetical protein [Candidatus Brocadiia bacterium]
MLSCTEFICAYNELFKFLHRRYGREAVDRLWEGISDEFLENLRELAARDGLRGMNEYWSRALTEEGGDWEIEMSPRHFEIRIRACPSVGKLRRAGHIEPYADYCGHCDTLYRRVLEPLGYRYEIEYIDREKGACRVRISLPEEEA